MYDAALGRWNAIDPLAEDYYSWTPYCYGVNNPVLIVDPDGRGGIISIYKDEDGNYQANITFNVYLYSDQNVDLEAVKGTIEGGADIQNGQVWAIVDGRKTKIDASVNVNVEILSGDDVDKKMVEANEGDNFMYVAEGKEGSKIGFANGNSIYATNNMKGEDYIEEIIHTGDPQYGNGGVGSHAPDDPNWNPSIESATARGVPKVASSYDYLKFNSRRKGMYKSVLIDNYKGQKKEVFGTRLSNIKYTKDTPIPQAKDLRLWPTKSRVGK
jgi:hypothetical protein